MSDTSAHESNFTTETDMPADSAPSGETRQPHRYTKLAHDYLGIPYQLSKEKNAVAEVNRTFAFLIAGPGFTAGLCVFSAYHFTHSWLTSLLIGVCIFTIVFLVESTIAEKPRAATFRTRLASASGRLVLVFCVSFVSGEVVSEVVFASRIEPKVAENRQKAASEAENEIRNQSAGQAEIATQENLKAKATAAIGELEAELEAAQARVTAATERVEEAQGIARTELEEGRNGRPPGAGDFFDAGVDALATAQDNLDKEIAFFDAANLRINGDPSDPNKPGSIALFRASIDENNTRIGEIRSEIDAEAEQALADNRKAKPTPLDTFVALNQLSGEDASVLFGRLALATILVLFELSLVLSKLTGQSLLDKTRLAKEKEDLAALDHEAMLLEQERADDLADRQADAVRRQQQREANNRLGALNGTFEEEVATSYQRQAKNGAVAEPVTAADRVAASMLATHARKAIAEDDRQSLESRKIEVATAKAKGDLKRQRKLDRLEAISRELPAIARVLADAERVAGGRRTRVDDNTI